MSQASRPSPYPPSLLSTGSPDNPIRSMRPVQAGTVKTKPKTYSAAQIQESANRITEAFTYISPQSAKNALLYSVGHLPDAIRLLLSHRDKGGRFDVPDDRAPVVKRVKGKGRKEAIDSTSDKSPSPPLAKQTSTGEVIDLTSDGSPSPPKIPRARAGELETFTRPVPNKPLFPSHLPRVRVKGMETVTLPAPRMPLSPSPQVPRSESSYDTIDMTTPSPPAKQAKSPEKVNGSNSKRLSFPTAMKDKYHLDTGFRSPTLHIQKGPKPESNNITDKCMRVLLSASDTYSAAANKAALDRVREQDPQLRKIMRTKSSPRDGVETMLCKCVERLEDEAKTLLREDMQRLVHCIAKVAEVKILKGSERQEANYWKVLPIPVGRSELYGIIDEEYLSRDGEAALTNFVEMWERKSDIHRLTLGSVVALAKDVARVTKALHQILVLDVEYTHMKARENDRWAGLLQD